MRAETSRATPITLRKSGRFGSTSISRTSSSRPSAVTRSSPGETASVFSTRMPVCTSAIANSRDEHSMPFETTPPMSRGASGSGSTGTRAPGRAQGTRSPASKLRMPAHTTCSPVPSSTVATVSFCEFGWSSTFTTRATTTPWTPLHGRSTSSTFTPCRVNRSASGFRRVLGRAELPQPRPDDPHTTPWNCSNRRTSPSTSMRMSEISYLSRATRSMPSPNANPV